MERVCPRCRGTTPEMTCPRCGVRTRGGEAGLAVTAADQESLVVAGWLVGLLLAQGLYYAFLHLANAGLLLRGNGLADLEYWDRFAGMVTTQGLQGIAVFIGGMIAAAGRRRGLLIGASVTPAIIDP